MEDSELPQSLGERKVPPPILSDKQKEICKRLDELHAVHGFQVKASEIFKGAIFASRIELRSNPDWISQTSNSLRETLYPFYSRYVKAALGSKEEILRKYGSARVSPKWIDKLSTVYNKIEGLTHHGAVDKNHTDFLKFTEEEFDVLVKEFEDTLFTVLARQVDIHSEIDQFLERNPENSKEQVKRAKELITLNTDAQQYFFFKSNEKWLKWLWENGFLDRIKEKAEDPTKYSLRMPELNYLDSMSKKDPHEIAQIILQTPISLENFNPETIDRFSRIIGELPAEELPDIVKKIRDEKWPELMFPFRQHWFEFENMFKKLMDSNNFPGALVLAECVLAIRKREKGKEEKEALWDTNPFLIENLIYTKVFDALIAFDKAHSELALALLTDVMARVVVFTAREKEQDDLFAVEDGFYLYDIDFFTITKEEEGYASKENIHNLAATLRLLTEKVFSEAENPKEIRKIYEKYILPLPESLSMLRFKLFALSLCPEEFLNEIEKELFWAIMDEKIAAEVTRRTEYAHLLQQCFALLSEDKKREYVAKVFELFSKEKGWKSMGNRITSCIFKELNEEELIKAEKLFGKLDPDYIPESSFGRMRGGTVMPQAPGTDDDWAKPIPEILQKLSEEWSPEILNKQSQDQDFLKPIDANGTGDRLKQVVLSRPLDTLAHAEQFFNLQKISSHYTYSFLRGVYDLLQQNKEVRYDLGAVFRLMFKVMQSDVRGELTKQKEEKAGHTWIAGWHTVKYAMADVIKILLSRAAGKLAPNFSKERNEILALIKYLLAIPDRGGRRISIEKEEAYEESDPFSVAINSVQGSAFEALTAFIFQDGLLLKQAGSEEKISKDIKDVYEEIVEKQDSLAMNFLIGYNLPTFYYRDSEWLKGLLPLIFPEEESKKNHFLAVLEGFLANNLYQEMFHDLALVEIYERGIKLSPAEYTKRKYFREIDEGIGTHLALAFVHYNDFEAESPLFKLFWEKLNKKRHHEFISFVGRHAISRSGEHGELKEVDYEKLEKFWEWALKNVKDPEVLEAFGFWINPSKNVFEVKWLAQKVKETMSLSNGMIDWQVGLEDQLQNFAQHAPENTVEILRLYLLKNTSEEARWVRVDENLTKVFTILYENIATKLETERLINDLISQKGSQYWDLKKIMDTQSDQNP